MLQNKLEMSFIVVEVQREFKSRVSLLKLEFGQDTRTELLCYLLICCTVWEVTSTMKDTSKKIMLVVKC